MSSSRTSADSGKGGGPEEIEETERRRDEVKKKQQRRRLSGNTLTLAVCACACGCVLTHGSPGEAHVCAPPVQADVGSSRRGSASGGPSSAFESHQQSSLQGEEQRRGSGPDQ